MDAGLPTMVDVDAVTATVRRQMQARYRLSLVVVAVVSLIVGGVIVAFTLRGKTSPAATALTPPPYWGQICIPAERTEETVRSAGATPPSLHIYISGAVKHPGVITVPAGSLVTDAVEAVGGATEDAALEEINLAAPLADNQHIVVPRYTPTPTPQAGRPSTTAAKVEPTTAATPSTTLVNLNTATAADLETLPHIGPTLAERIIAYREANGPFRHIEDLKKVEGIGETRYQDIAPFITVEP